jgi:DNA-binding response OmpR family regulator
VSESTETLVVAIGLATLQLVLTVETGSAKTILICEDDQNLRQLVRAVLGDGYRFLEAQDGDQALELALRARPDLIILDLMMPGRSGLEVLDHIREQLPTATTRVIVMSAWGHADEAALSAGADRFVPKPFEADELTAIVKDVLEAV